MKNNSLKIIKQIEKIRAKNNVNWMNILRLALNSTPTRVKIMKKINYDDKKVNYTKSAV